MIVKEYFKKNDIDYTRIYSDKKLYIKDNNGIVYQSVAHESKYDSERSYIESDIKIEDNSEDDL